MTSILFVCLGNICRSPAAEGFLRHMAAQDATAPEVSIQSCGMGNWHMGHLPDERIRNAANTRGVLLTSRAQRFHPTMLDQFDYILAADHEVLNDLYKHAESPEHKSKIHLITHFSEMYRDQEIPDPYYGGDAGFELVLDMIHDSCQGLLSHLKK